MSKKRPKLWVFAILLLSFLYVPLLVLSIKSFQGGPTLLHWYVSAFSNPELVTSLLNSIWIGIGSTIIATILGTLGALGLRNKDFPFRASLESVLNLPLVLPEIVIGLSLLVWFSFLKITLGLFSVILAHGTFSLSYVTLLVLSRIQTLDPMLEEAAADLGATKLTTFRRVTFPLLLPAIISGALLSFTLSFDDFLITFFTSGVGSDTLPLRIYSMMRFGLTPEINAISFSVLFFTFISVMISMRLQKT